MWCPRHLSSAADALPMSESTTFAGLAHRFAPITESRPAGERIHRACVSLARGKTARRTGERHHRMPGSGPQFTVADRWRLSRSRRAWRQTKAHFDLWSILSWRSRSLAASSSPSPTSSIGDSSPLSTTSSRILQPSAAQSVPPRCSATRFRRRSPPSLFCAGWCSPDERSSIDGDVHTTWPIRPPAIPSR